MPTKGDPLLGTNNGRKTPSTAEEFAVHLDAGGWLHAHNRGLHWAVLFRETEFCRDNPEMCFRLRLKNVAKERKDATNGDDGT